MHFTEGDGYLSGDDRGLDTSQEDSELSQIEITKQSTHNINNLATGLLHIWKDLKVMSPLCYELFRNLFEIIVV